MIIAFDTETFYSPQYSVAELGPRAYVEHPQFECYMISVADGPDDGWVGHPSKFKWEMLNGHTLVSHNAMFDINVYLAMKDAGLAPPLQLEGWHCTADLASYVCGQRSLKDAVKALYNVELSKAERSNMSGKHWEDLDPEAQRSFTEYARRDAEWCWRLWNDYAAQWPIHEQLLSQITRESAMRGVAINTQQLHEMTALVHQQTYKLADSLPWIKQYPPSSPKGFAEECRKCGIPVPKPKSHDYDEFDAWAAEHSPKHPWIHQVEEWRSSNKVLTTLNTIGLRLRPDKLNSECASIEAPLKYWGAHTGRWSGDTGINFQNFRKTALKVGDVDVDVRSLIIPRTGHTLIICDLAQIEPRILWWLAEDWDALDLVAQGMSPYEVHARATMGWDSEQSLKQAAKEDPKAAELYNMAKIRVLALGYGAGWKKLITIAMDYGLTLDEETSKKVVNAFRATNPKITGLWDQLDTAFRMSTGRQDHFVMGLPSGRSMVYKDVRRNVVFELNEKTGKQEKRWVYTAEVRGMRRKLYGGLLTENIVQATARDVFADGLMRVHAAGHRILFTCHDEVVVEATPGATPKTIADLMSVTPSWMPKLPVGASADETDCYQKL